MSDITKLLPSNHIPYNNWLNIDHYEVEEGKIAGKVREKILDR